MDSMPPAFERSISLNDLDVASVVREQVQRDLTTPQDDDSARHQYLKTLSQYSFVLPSFNPYSLDFKKFLYSYLLDMAIQKLLEGVKVLNWCVGVFPMVSVLTIGDGNCLMHAASLAMWAISDRYQTLRKAVYNALIEDTEGRFHRRWHREHQISIQQVHGGYEMTEEQWRNEWHEVLRLVSSDQAPGGPNALPYDSLEEIHIFVLANVLRRTIIVLSDDTLRGNYDESLSPINFSGVYLPLNWDPVDCVRTPLVIGYSQGHFTALVSFADGRLDQGETRDELERNQMHGVPLVKNDGTPLAVHFLLEEEEQLRDGLLRQYLDCGKVTHRDKADGRLTKVTLVARLQMPPPPDSVKNLVDGYFARASETYQHMLSEMREVEQNREPSVKLEKCRTQGCPYFGSSQTGFMCSKCVEDHLKKLGAAEDDVVAGVSGLTASPALEGLPPQWLVGQQQQFQQYQQQQMGIEQPELQRIQEGYHNQTEQQQQQRSQQGLKEHEASKSKVAKRQGRQEQQQQRFEEQGQDYKNMEQFYQTQEPLQQQQQLAGEEYIRQQRQVQQQQQMHVTYQQRQQQGRQDQQQQPAFPPQTRMLTKFSMEQPHPKCSTPGCKYNADPATGKWCVRCYESERNPEEGVPCKREITSKLCRNSSNGCKYYGLPAQYDLCSRCYRRFCIKMETTHGGSIPLEQQPPTARLPPSTPYSAAPSTAPGGTPTTRSVPPAAPGEVCQEPRCSRAGVPELYGRCVECYSQCIRAFITSEERTVSMPAQTAEQKIASSAAPAAPRPGSPPKTTQPTLAAPSSQRYKKGNLCATPGCPHERMSSVQELCLQCYQIQPRQAPQIAVARPVPLTEENPTLLSLSGIHLKEQLQAPPTPSKIYCSAGKCNNPVGCFTGDLCTQCFSEQHKAATPTVPSPATAPPQATQQLIGTFQQPPPQATQPLVGTSQQPTTQAAQIPQVTQSSQVTGVFGQAHVTTGSPSPGRDARKQLPPLYMPKSAATRNAPSPYQSSMEATNAAFGGPPKMAVTLPTPGVTPQGNESGIRCATPNCNFFGIRERNFLCSGCYERNVGEWKTLNMLVTTPSSPMITSPAVAVTSPNAHVTSSVPPPMATGQVPPKQAKCAMEGCSNTGLPAYSGLCQSCYYKAVHSEAEWNAQQQRAGSDKQRAFARPLRQQQQVSRPSYPPQSLPSARTQTTAPPATKQGKASFVNTGTPCKTKGCLRFGTPTKDDLCDVCFEKFQRKQAQKPRPSPSTSRSVTYGAAPNRHGLETYTTSSAQRPAPAQMIARYVAGGTKCAQPGCNMYGTPETNGYCSKCLMDMMRSAYPESVPDREVTDVTQRQPNLSNSVTGHATPSVCSVVSCNNLANPYLRSHCTQCFEKAYPDLAKSEDYLPAIIADYKQE